MFTFSNLGRLGRFGNQLFQIASTIGIALKNGHEYVFPAWEHTKHFQRPIPQSARPLNADLILSQGPCHLQRMDFKLTTSQAHLVDLKGLFYSEKYFLHCKELVHSYFDPATLILREINKSYGECLKNEPTCIVVVKRGDYAFYPLQNPMMPAQFYRQAMEMFRNDTTFIVTSDDVEWCKANITAKRIVYLPQEKWVHNFFLGTLCQDAIISNTSFGWWIAWLNKNSNKRVVAPKQWFGPGYSHLDTRDLLPENWVTIKEEY
jgi:hypothetical protein